METINQSEAGWVLKRVMENQGSLLQCNWGLKGELELDLSLHTLDGAPCFELARYLDDPTLPPLLINDSDMARDVVLELLEAGGKYTDILWKAYSPESLEEYLEESRLPLPFRYQEFWSIIDSQFQANH